MDTAFFGDRYGGDRNREIRVEIFRSPYWSSANLKGRRSKVPCANAHLDCFWYIRREN